MEIAVFRPSIVAYKSRQIVPHRVILVVYSFPGLLMNLPNSSSFPSLSGLLRSVGQRHNVSKS